MKWKKLAPEIIRQRVIIEATTPEIAKPKQITEYLNKLAEVTDMEKLREPYVYSAHEMGYGAWIHWKTSGATVYSYPTDPALLTVDCYTCKPFCAKKAVEFTKEFFNTKEIVWKEV